jgi:hypothetical protein
MSKKQITIIVNSCSNCPNSLSNDLDDENSLGEGICELTDDQIDLTSDDFPPTCPLSDYQEKESN